MIDSEPTPPSLVLQSSKTQMADVAKRPFAADGGMEGALVKRQRIDEGALVIGSVTKDVSSPLPAWVI